MEPGETRKFQSEDVVFQDSYRRVTFVLFSLFGARTGENVGGVSVSPELFRYVVDGCVVERLL